MALDRFKKEMGIIAALDDEPNDVGGLSAAELKGKFDEGGIALQKFINETLIPALEELGIETIVKNGGKADTIRVNDEMMLEVSDDGETFVVVGAGHKIVDKDGKELPRRLKLQFVNGDLSTTDQATVVRITPNWTDINGAPFGDVIIYQDSYELSAFPDSAFTATSNTGERFSFHKVSDNALSYKQLSDTTFTLRLADASANAKFDDSSLYQRTRDYTHFYLGAITVGNQTLDNYAYFAAYKAGTITTQDGETIKIPAVGLYIGKEETKSFPFGTWKPNGIQPVAYGLVVSYVCEDVVPIDKKYLPEVFVDGVQPDWNQNDPDALDYVKNRTHWEEVLAEGGTIFPETDVEFKTSMAVLNGIGTEQVSVGQKYIVTWRGTEYECTAFLLFANDPSSVTLGNSSLLFVGNNTGEPFCLSDFTTSNCIVTKDTSTATTIKIKVDEVRNAVVVPIPKKYLPAGVAYTDTAKVGQTIVVKEVDSTGKPTAWEAVDMSAGGGGGSWDDLSAPMPTKFLPDGVPYVEEGIVELPVTGQWYEETDEDGNVSDSGYFVTAPIGLQVGSTYTVNWNGTDYEVTGQDASTIPDNGIPGVVLGNLAAMGGDDTGEPFLMMEVPADIAAEMGAYGMITSFDLSINIPFAIYGEGGTIQKIDPRCLPTGVPYIEESDDFTATLLPETEAVLVDASEGIWGIEAVPLLKIGETYLVNYNGTEYTCVAQDASAPADEAGSVGLGELSNLGGFGNGEPFVFFTRPSLGVSYLLNNSSSTVPTVSIYGKGVKVHKLDNRCLDLAWLPTVEKTDVEVQGETTFTKSMTNMEFQYDEFLVGAEVAVVFDGVRYECTVVKEGTTGALVIGNLSILSAELGSDTGEPFCIYSPGTNGYYVLVFADENEHTVAVYAVDAQYNVIPDGFLGEGRSRIFSLDDMGMPSVETDTTETITVDTSEIVNILISGGKVNLSFNCTLSAGAGSTIVSVSAVLDGTKTKLNYHWSSLHYAEDFCLYAFIVDVNDTTISVTNRKIA